MNCPRCNAPNESDARFCKNCALPFFQYQQAPIAPSVPSTQTTNDKSLLYMVIIIGLFCFESIFYLFLEKVVAPVLNRGFEYGQGMTTIYTICSWSFDLITITLSIIFLIRSKNKMVRIVLIVYALINLISFFRNDIAPLFEKKNDFIYYQF